MKLKLLIGGIVCFLQQQHLWRRLRKAETFRLDRPQGHATHTRICDRCETFKVVKPRKAKVTT